MKKSKQKKTMKVIIILVAIVILTFFSLHFVYGKEIIEESEFGNWGSEITFRYANGNTKPLMWTNTPLSIFYGGNEIEGVLYSLKASAVGGNQGTVEIDFTDYSYTVSIAHNGQVFNTYTYTPYYLEKGVNSMIFSQEAINYFSDNSVETIFGRLSNNLQYIFEEGTWASYVYGRPINALNHISPNTVYWVTMINPSDFEVFWDMPVDGNWYNYLHTYQMGSEVLPEDFSDKLFNINGNGWNENIIFPSSLFQYNSQMASDNSVENFCQVGGIWEEILSIFENSTMKNWQRGANVNTLNNIEPYGGGSTEVYSFKVLSTCELYFIYDLLPDGTYTITFTPGGSIYYRPAGLGWSDASLPSPISFDVIRNGIQPLKIIFNQEVGTN